MSRAWLNHALEKLSLGETSKTGGAKNARHIRSESGHLGWASSRMLLPSALLTGPGEPQRPFETVSAEGSVVTP